MSWSGQLWKFNIGDEYMDRTLNPFLSNILYLVKDTFTFSSNKSYIYRTEIHKLDELINFDNLKLTAPWVDSFVVSFESNSGTFSQQDGYIYFESSPSNDLSTDHWINYTANDSLLGRGIMNTSMYELDWKINGFSWINDGANVSMINSRTNIQNKRLICSGWNYDIDSEAYYYYDLGTESHFYPSGGELNTIDENYKKINYIHKYIGANYFNLYFSYDKGNNSDDSYGMKLYLSDNLPYNGTDTTLFDDFLSGCVLLGEYGTQSVDSTYLGLDGYKYVVFVADNATIINTNNLIAINNIKIEGKYYPVNNEIIEFDVVYTGLTPTSLLPAIPLVGATFSLLTGNNTAAYLLSSKVGNGDFQAGRWENGVWNNGWREDVNIFEFYDVDLSIKTYSDIKWLVRIIGASASVNNFQIGDEVSIGNMVGIDINEKRKLLKDYYKIVGKSLSNDGRTGNILIELETSFPLRRIERDSKNHKMYVSKNIWLSGVFLNGYFSGIWNNGLFKGYPQITEMYETQWIDGIFDGGHFNSDYYIYGDFTDTFNSNNRLGLSFSSPHNLAKGDTIIVDKYNKSVNSYYDGEHSVTSIIDEYKIETDLQYGSIIAGETGSYTTPYKTALVQNMTFDSNNISKTTSIDSLISTEVFVYNSWMDIKYDEESAVNIGKNQTKLNDVSRKYYSDNNLYGYPSNDVLSSDSYFRDSYTLNENSYKLGVKYKIFNDYIGESSVFSDYFDSQNIELFLQRGWTISTATTSYATYSRTDGDGVFEIEGEELNIKTNKIGTYLDTSTPTIEVFNRDNREIAKKRYTIAEFDLVAYSATNSFYYPVNVDEPAETIINFNNINKINRIGYTYSISATYLPIYENINHLNTTKKRKIEYFYNKRNLSLNIKGNGSDGINETDVTLNNLKLYEVDMIPFFQYFKTENINNSVQIPYQGIAPYIDYTKTDFNFIDNVSLGFDSTVIQSTIDLVSGIGVGIIDADENVDNIINIVSWETYNNNSIKAI